MSDRTYKWQEQPYIPWKGLSTNSAVPAWSRPLINGPTNDVPSGPAFKARPIKHWRKQLAPRVGSGRSSTGIGMPMDRPGGSTYLGDNPERCKCETTDETVNLKENITRTHKIVKPKASDTVYNENGKPVCVACNPEANVIKSASTILNKKYYTDSRAYLRSRNMTYEQKLSGTRANGIKYFGPDGELLWPTNSVDGPQVRAPSDCPARCDTASGARYGSRAIYKPNNRQFGVQGAVSSSSRLERLKLNTITKNGSSLRSAFGSEGANAGKYHGTSTAPYFLKSKMQKCVPHHRNGDHTNCFLTPTGSIGKESFEENASGIAGDIVGDGIMYDDTIYDDTIYDDPGSDLPPLDCSSLGVADSFNGTSYTYKNNTYCCASGSFHTGTSTEPSGCTDRTQVCAVNVSGGECGIIPCYVADMSNARQHFGLAALNGKLYAIGGYDALLSSFVVATEMYNPILNSWTTVDWPISGVEGIGLAAVLSSNGVWLLYVMGGLQLLSRSDGIVNVAEVYNETLNTWSTLKEMSVGRAWFGVVVVNGYVYAVGGITDYSNNIVTNTMESYDPDEKIWTDISGMTTPRAYMGVAALNDNIYAVGGWDGSSILKSAEVYDTVRHEWSGISDMRTYRSGLGIAALNGKIYAVGGASGASDKVLNSGEVYDPETLAWSPIAPMSIARTGLSLAVLDGKIYATGGDQGMSSTLKSVEVYDPDIDKWSNVTEPQSEIISHVMVEATHYGSGHVYVIDGIQKNKLTFQVGKTYSFSHPSSHPLRLSTTANGTHGGGTELKDVTIKNDSITLAVTSDTPTTLYYYCSIHSGMGSTITIS